MGAHESHCVKHMLTTAATRGSSLSEGGSEEPMVYAGKYLPVTEMESEAGEPMVKVAGHEPTPYRLGSATKNCHKVFYDKERNTWTSLVNNADGVRQYPHSHLYCFEADHEGHMHSSTVHEIHHTAADMKACELRRNAAGLPPWGEQPYIIDQSRPIRAIDRFRIAAGYPTFAESPFLNEAPLAFWASPPTPSASSSVSAGTATAIRNLKSINDPRKINVLTPENASPKNAPSGHPSPGRVSPGYPSPG
eukprot:Selendium_serpulae@DN1490_c0_g1_i1.p1